MDIESMRKEFEARFPVPEGVVYQPDYNFYAGMDGYQNVARHYDAKFEAWQAAKEQGNQYDCNTVPEGWQLVPKEPTAEMCLAAEAEADANGSWTLIYAAMLSAAPEVKP